jgi:hypothetical protein
LHLDLARAGKMPRPRRRGERVIRLFNIYYPTRMLVLLGGEALLVCISFLIAVVLRRPEDVYAVLIYHSGFFKILVATAAVLVFSHLFDLMNLASGLPMAIYIFVCSLCPQLLRFS